MLFLISQKAAIFWWNLRKNGEGDEDTLHAGCPVLVGDKWGKSQEAWYVAVMLSAGAKKSYEYGKWQVTAIFQTSSLLNRLCFFRHYRDLFQSSSVQLSCYTEANV